MTLLISLLLLSSQTLPVQQDNVVPVYGCGTSCRVKTEQLSLPEQMPDGWIRVKVRRRKWLRVCNEDTKQCVYKPASGKRAGPPVQDLWLFANCSAGRFASSINADRSDGWERSAFYENGQPKRGTAHGNPYRQWAKLCPVEAKEGITKPVIQNHQRLMI